MWKDWNGFAHVRRSPQMLVRLNRLTLQMFSCCILLSCFSFIWFSCLLCLGHHFCLILRFPVARLWKSILDALANLDGMEVIRFYSFYLYWFMLCPWGKLFMITSLYNNTGLLSLYVRKIFWEGNTPCVPCRVPLAALARCLEWFWIASLSVFSKFCFFYAGKYSVQAGNWFDLFLDALAQLSRNLLRPWKRDGYWIKPVPLRLLNLKA